MSSVNKVILVGRLGKDPEIRRLENGKAVASLTLATSEKYKDSEQVEWHSLELWDKLADIAEKYLAKGALIYVEGKIKTDTWEKEGVKQYRTKIVVFTMQMLGSKTNSEGVTNGVNEGVNNDLDSLPF